MKKREKIFTALALAAVLTVSPIAIPAVISSADTKINVQTITDFDCMTETGISLSGQKVVIKTLPDGSMRTDTLTNPTASRGGCDNTAP